MSRPVVVTLKLPLFAAVPLAGALQVVLAHLLRSEDPSQAEEHRDPADRAAHQNPAAARTAA